MTKYYITRRLAWALRMQGRIAEAQVLELRCEGMDHTPEEEEICDDLACTATHINDWSKP